MQTIGKKLLAFLVIFFSAVAPISARANDVWHSSNIEKIYPQGDGSFVLTFITDAPACSNVNQPKYHYIRAGYNNVDQEGVDKMYSAALTAATLGKKINFNFDDSTDKCFINRLSISF